MPEETRDRQRTKKQAHNYRGTCDSARYPKSGQRRSRKNEWRPTTNKKPQAVEHINEEGIETATDPACPIRTGPSQPIVKEQAIPNTGADSECNTDQPEMPETELQDTQIDEDEKHCDEPQTGLKPQQQVNPKPTTPELSNGNKTTEGVNTTRVEDRITNVIVQTPHGETGDKLDARNNPQRPKNLNLKAMANRQPSEKGAERGMRRQKETNNAAQIRPPPSQHGNNKHSKSKYQWHKITS